MRVRDFKTPTPLSINVVAMRTLYSMRAWHGFRRVILFLPVRGRGNGTALAEFPDRVQSQQGIGLVLGSLAGCSWQPVWHGSLWRRLSR